MLLEPVATIWVCPNCTGRDRTFERRPHTRMHSCPGLLGLTAPMVREGVRCRVRPVERGDYVKDELVQRDGEGRPWMAVVTDRDDGMDCAVLAPTARAMKEESRG